MASHVSETSFKLAVHLPINFACKLILILFQIIQKDFISLFPFAMMVFCFFIFVVCFHAYRTKVSISYKTEVSISTIHNHPPNKQN